VSKESSHTFIVDRSHVALVSEQFDFDGTILMWVIEATFRRRPTKLLKEVPIGLSHAFVAYAGSTI
jgi:hypothetical protein